MPSAKSKHLSKKKLLTFNKHPYFSYFDVLNLNKKKSIDNLKFKSRFAVGIKTQQLRQLHVPIRTDEECKEAYKNSSYPVDENVMFCAGYKERGRDGCTLG